MSARYTRNMLQTATHWRADGNDGFGPTFAEPVLIKCRWQSTSEVFTDAAGSEFVAKSVVYTHAAVKLGDGVGVGGHTETRDGHGAGRDGDTRPSKSETVTLIRPHKLGR